VAPGRIMPTKLDEAMTHDADRARAEGPVPGQADNRPALPYAKAFVVQFGAETDVWLGTVTGRAEHLQTPPIAILVGR
jgi:hypothetical protein